MGNGGRTGQTGGRGPIRAPRENAADREVRRMEGTRNISQRGGVVAPGRGRPPVSRIRAGLLR